MFGVVVIDDNRALVEMLLTTVRWGEMDCVLRGTAYDGIRGLELIRREQPDIIIADIRMPGMDGLKMAEEVHQAKPKAKILFISAYDDFSYAQQAVKLHAHDYLLKPFEIAKLEASVRLAVEDLRNEELPSSENTGADVTLIKRILRYIETHPEHPTLEETAEHFGYNASYISSLVKKQTGENYMEWVARSRIRKAKKMLKDPKYRIEEVAEAVGYKNYANFYNMFVKTVGISPRDYRYSSEADDE